MSRRGENIHKRKDGRWEGRVKTQQGKYHSIYGKTYGAVKEKMHEFFKEQNKYENNCFSKARFEDILLKWQEINRLKHKGSTEARYDYLLKTHILPDLGSYDITEINTEIINRYIEGKLFCGRLDGQGGLSPAYVRSIVNIITSAIQFSVNEQYRDSLKTSVYKPTPEKKELQILDKHEQKKLECYLLSDPTPSKTGVLLSLHTGMRMGEVCALRWSDVDLTNGIINVRNTVSRTRTSSYKYALIISKPKTKASIRDIPISPVLVQLLNDIKKESISEFVISDSEQFVNPRTFEYRFHKILKQCGVKRINHHALRHTFATRCIEVGVDVKTLSEILGHASISLTMNTYVHSSIDLKRMQLEKLSYVMA